MMEATSISAVGWFWNLYNEIQSLFPNFYSYYFPDMLLKVEIEFRDFQSVQLNPEWTTEEKLGKITFENVMVRDQLEFTSER